MIFAASYFQTERHHGQLISISRSIPRGFRVDGRLDFFVPSADLLRDWQGNCIDEIEYTDRYREQIRANLKPIKAWLERLDPKEDQTLLCWEKSGNFCHRNLAIKLVERYRKDCYGGCDLLSR